MPVFLNKKINNVTVAIWQINEPYSELIKIARLNTNEKKLYNSYKNKLRKTQFLATRALLNTIYLNNVFIKYSKTGEPALSNGERISISHSKEWVGIIISKNLVGIDVEVIDKKIHKITSRFLSNSELKNILNNDIQTLFLYWCAKESMVKITNNKSYIYNKHLIIKPFKQKKHGTFKGFIVQENKELELMFNYEIHEKLVFVWSVIENN
ncbi:MAG: 4'-phosphopantetheinyl transferase superfamily protein [Chlorobi bacterium]|nr:4'-phosphopantetheinyl transferase superfamily protein [Chlorobiota bacterium]